MMCGRCQQQWLLQATTEPSAQCSMQRCASQVILDLWRSSVGVHAAAAAEIVLGTGAVPEWQRMCISSFCFVAATMQELCLKAVT
jgi:hypothetical protein